LNMADAWTEVFSRIRQCGLRSRALVFLLPKWVDAVEKCRCVAGFFYRGHFSDSRLDVEA
jgi:hypothetical protein